MTGLLRGSVDAFVPWRWAALGSDFSSLGLSFLVWEIGGKRTLHPHTQEQLGGFTMAWSACLVQA